MKRFASDAFSIILTQSYIAGQHLLYSLGLLLEGVRCQYFGRLLHWYLSALKLCVVPVVCHRPFIQHIEPFFPRLAC